MTYSELRASDAERERVVSFLREHAVLGRLTSDELEERVGRAYAAVTVGDLELLIQDLPRPGHAPARRARQRRFEPQRRPSTALLGVGAGALLLSGLPFAAVALVAAFALTALVAVFALSMLLGPLLLVALLILGLSKRRRPSHRPRHRPVRWGPQY
jgi:Flp pilus assembly protein TadB